MRVYVVETIDKSGNRKLSQEGYLTYEGAERFVKSRSDNPKKIEAYMFESDIMTYCICDIFVNNWRK